MRKITQNDIDRLPEGLAKTEARSVMAQGKEIPDGIIECFLYAHQEFDRELITRLQMAVGRQE